jgi:hypothetical protein
MAAGLMFSVKASATPRRGRPCVPPPGVNVRLRTASYQVQKATAGCNTA